MDRLLIAGTGSGCGKTTVSCALLSALKHRGKNVAAFKCGPDYIDPMFHKKASSVDSYNLDVFLMGEENVRYCLSRHGESRDLCLIEGVMGLYDGAGDGGFASSNHVSLVTDTPAVLVADVRGKAQSLCAEISGYLKYEKNNIRGIILNNTTEAMYPFYKDMLERRLPVKTAGFLPNIPEARIGSRHLGLITANEIADIRRKLEILAEYAEKYLDLPLLLELAADASPLKIEDDFLGNTPRSRHFNIYIANDEAFGFYYEDNHELLRALGAELRFFSPIRDKELPKDAHGLILWGGYPELYANKLSVNYSMKRSIAERVKKGLPVYAECGGFIYMQEQLTDKDGETYPMLGVIKGRAKMTERLQNFGYATLTANRDTMLCDKGARVSAHSFHYFSSDYEGDSFTAEKISSGASYPCVAAENNIFAGYPHIHFWGNRKLAGRFTEACVKYAKEARHGIYNQSQ